MQIQFTKNISIKVHEKGSESTSNENWIKGEKVKFSVLRENKNTVVGKFGNGSIGYNIPKNSFEVIKL